MREITIEATIDNLSRVNELMESVAEETGLSMKAQLQMDIVIDELVSNIVQYAYPDHPGTINIRAGAENGSFYMTFTDQGIPYDPLDAADPDITAGAEERRIGGLGIFMVKKLTDKIEYRYESGHNILTVWKKL